jgi:phosphoglycerate dehydrogenase-like enzyme
MGTIGLIGAGKVGSQLARLAAAKRYAEAKRYAGM